LSILSRSQAFARGSRAALLLSTHDRNFVMKEFRSALDELEKIPVNDIGMGGRHSVGKAGIRNQPTLPQ
jgi:hypothetical protein